MAPRNKLEAWQLVDARRAEVREVATRPRSRCEIARPSDEVRAVIQQNIRKPAGLFLLWVSIVLQGSVGRNEKSQLVRLWTPRAHAAEPGRSPNVRCSVLVGPLRAPQSRAREKRGRRRRACKCAKNVTWYIYTVRIANQQLIGNLSPASSHPY